MFANYGYKKDMKRILAKQIQQILIEKKQPNLAPTLHSCLPNETTLPENLLTLFWCVLFVAASMPRLFSLGAHWTSDEAGWLDHSTVFMAAVEMGAFSETLVTFHPGVITMWLAALRTLFTEPHISVQGLALARWFIGVALLIGIGVAAMLLLSVVRTLGCGHRCGVSILLSTLFSPIPSRPHRCVGVDFSPVNSPVPPALLSDTPKTPLPCRFWNCIRSSLPCQKLLPYSALVAAYLFLTVSESGGDVGAVLSPRVGAGLCFLSCTLLTVFALWPLFWNPIFLIFGLCLLAVTLLAYRELQKGADGRLTLYLASVVVVGVVSSYMVRTVWRVFDGVAWAITTPHNLQHFFLGQVLYDPGWLFYPLVLCINTTPLTLPLVFAGCLFLWRKRHEEGYARQSRIALALVAVVLLFTLCLSLTSKKFSRYLLPAFPILEILAAVGFLEFLKWGYSYIDSRFGTETNSQKLTFSIVTILCIFLIQILPVLRLHPYYGTYYNLCFKLTDIRKIITVGEGGGTGYDLAAKYLNAKPNAQALRVQTFPPSSQFFFPILYRAEPLD